MKRKSRRKKRAKTKRKECGKMDEKVKKFIDILKEAIKDTWMTTAKEVEAFIAGFEKGINFNAGIEEKAQKQKKKERFTDEEIDYIIENYPEHKPSEIAERLGRDVKSVYDKIRDLKNKRKLEGTGGNTKKGRYTKDEVDFIIKNYGQMKISQMAKELGRTEKQIGNKIWWLKKQGKIKEQKETKTIVIDEIEDEVFEMWVRGGWETISNQFKKRVERRFGGKRQIRSLARIIREGIEARGKAKCRDCPLIKEIGEGQYYCSVRKGEVKPEQYICKKMIGVIPGEE